jgi:hypothetical protein
MVWPALRRKLDSLGLLSAVLGASPPAGTETATSGSSGDSKKRKAEGGDSGSGSGGAGNALAQLHTYAQRTRTAIEYEKVGEEGPPHSKKFVFKVKVGGEVYGEGRGQKIKGAHLEAAKVALEKLKSEGKDINPLPRDATEKDREKKKRRTGEDGEESKDGAEDEHKEGGVADEDEESGVAEKDGEEKEEEDDDDDDDDDEEEDVDEERGDEGEGREGGEVEEDATIITRT